MEKNIFEFFINNKIDLISHTSSNFFDLKLKDPWERGFRQHGDMKKLNFESSQRTTTSHDLEEIGDQISLKNYLKNLLEDFLR